MGSGSTMQYLYICLMIVTGHGIFKKIKKQTLIDEFSASSWRVILYSKWLKQRYQTGGSRARCITDRPCLPRLHKGKIVMICHVMWSSLISVDWEQLLYVSASIDFIYGCPWMTRPAHLLESRLDKESYPISHIVTGHQVVSYKLPQPFLSLTSELLNPF